MKFRNAVMLLAAAPLLMAGKCSPNKDKGKDGEVIDDSSLRPPRPIVSLVVAGMDPSTANPGQPMEAEVFGTAFVKGATVAFSGQPATTVTWTSAGSLQVTVPGLAEGRYDVTVTNPDGTQASLRGALEVTPSQSRACGSVTVHFELDSVGIFPDDRAALDALAACYARTNDVLRVDGHCDERGTTEYNLALGQRRADTVAAYLTGLGLPRNRVHPVSYGEERPVSNGHDESSWAANRRADISPQ